VADDEAVRQDPEEARASLSSEIVLRGGAAVEVLSWGQYASFTEAQQNRVGMVLHHFPELNTVAAVDRLAEALVYHGEEFGSWWLALLDRYDIELITLAMETLRELGGRDGAPEPTPTYVRRVLAERFDLDDMLELMAMLKEIGHPSESYEQLCRLIQNRLGGWELARLLEPAQAEGILSGLIDVEDLHQEVFGGDDEREMEEAWRAATQLYSLSPGSEGDEDEAR
jgi:hypothetical protein